MRIQLISSAIITLLVTGCSLKVTAPSTAAIATPTPTPTVQNKAVQISQSGGTACAVLDDASIKCWGRNSYAQLMQRNGYVGAAAGQMGDHLTAIDFGAGRSLKSLGEMSWQQCAILDDDSVKCWGYYNADGEMGYGDTLVRDYPTSETVALGTGKVPVQLVGGMYFSCARFADGTVKCWGKNDYGQLGQGDTSTRGSAANQMGDNLPVINLGTGKTAKAIAAGSYHACAILNDDTLKCWGDGANGRLGYGDTANRGSAANQMGDNLPTVSLGTGRTAKKISLGSHQTCAILDNDKVKCWGTNTLNNGVPAGRLGLGDTIDHGSAANQMGDNLPYVDLGTGHTAKLIKQGYASVCAILDDNSTKCWGDNSAGELGLGDTTLRGDGVGLMGDSLPAVNFGTGVYAVSIEAQSNSPHFCALLNNGKVKCWGSNSKAQLGQGNLTDIGGSAGQMGDNLSAIDLGTGKTAVSLNVTSYASCAILNDGTERCWGFNDGTLGTKTLEVGDDSNETGNSLPTISFGAGLTVQKISAGYTPCALFTNGSVKCWGMNTYGNVGLGNTNHYGDEVTETATALPFVDLGTGRTATKIFNYGYQVCALLDNSALKCWGYGPYGALGYGDTTSRGSAANQMGDNLPAVNVGTGKTVVDLGAGYLHNCALLNDSTVKCWGYNYYGELGYGNTTNRGSAANQMGDNMPAVSLGTGRTAKAVAAGMYHTCAILDNDSVKCWGMNTYGQLGYGNTTNYGSAANQMGDNLPVVDLGTGRTAKSIYAGDYFTCALLDNNAFKCWGRNNFAQLGQGDFVNRGVSAGQMGDSLPAISLGTGRTIKSVALGSGARNVCVILDNDALKCWGSNTYGVLASGNTNIIGGATGDMGDNLPTVDLGYRAAP